MILKASKRAGAKQLSDHLLNADTNEHVFVEEVRGFMSDRLNDALQETYVQAKANKRVKKFMLSVSINPPSDKVVSKKSLVEAADAIEKRLGLTGQPRVLVTHEKDGRRHMHAVFNLMDENLKVIKLDYYKKRLNQLSRELYLKHGWELPKGFKKTQERDITNFDLSEAHMAERQKLNPKEVKARLQTCWQQSDNLDSFKQALSQEGYVLAKGDTKNIFMLVDMQGEVRSLSRALSVSAKDVKAKLGVPDTMPSIDEAKQAITQTQKAALIKAQADIEKRHETHLITLKTQLFDMKVAHRQARKELSRYHQKRQAAELQNRQQQFGSPFKKAWLFISGQSSYLKKKHAAEYEASKRRDEDEKEAMVQAQLRERRDLHQQLKTYKQQHQSQLLRLNALASRGLLNHAHKLNLTRTFSHHNGEVQTPNTKRHPSQELEL
ncbi:hypothetical protein EYS14_13530 [Alteromonadaceae bacterium M269]|nr:hypothetical protein EYS14_13530 [Alteromonadaceae bacterium M269]